MFDIHKKWTKKEDYEFLLRITGAKHPISWQEQLEGFEDE
jgi:hypothetical protein